MPFVEITNEFRRLVEEQEAAIPEAKRRKANRSRPTSNALSLDSTYIAEAYNIVSPCNCTLTSKVQYQFPAQTYKYPHWDAF